MNLFLYSVYYCDLCTYFIPRIYLEKPRREWGVAMGRSWGEGRGGEGGVDGPGRRYDTKIDPLNVS